MAFHCKRCGRRIKKRYYYDSGLCSPCYYSKFSHPSHTKPKHFSLEDPENFPQFDIFKISIIDRLSAFISSLIVLCIVLAFFGIPIYLIYFWVTGQNDDALFEKNVLTTTNYYRAQAGVGSLQYDDKLAAAAKAHAQDMCNKFYYAHVSPDGITPEMWVTKAGANYSRLGENIYESDEISGMIKILIDFTGYSEVTNVWYASPEHKENMLNPIFRRIGAGTANCFLTDFKYVQVFTN